MRSRVNHDAAQPTDLVPTMRVTRISGEPCVKHLTTTTEVKRSNTMITFVSQMMDLNRYLVIGHDGIGFVAAYLGLDEQYPPADSAWFPIAPPV
ncbi:MAG: hypothetical protein WC505_05900 [Patescibacteria group bacterium]